MTKRTLSAFGAALALITGLVITSTGNASAGVAFTTDFCTGDHASTPCIVSATRNTSPIASGNATWGVTALKNVGDSTDISWAVVRQDPGSYDLQDAATGDSWVIVIDVGHVVPRVAHEYADGVTITRLPQGDGTYHVRIAASPITFLDNDECDPSVWPWTCPETAGSETTILQGTVTDYGVWSDVEQRNAMYGMNYSTNVEVTSLPPEIASDATTGLDYLLIRMANSHYHPVAEGHGVFHGFAHLRIPNQFLRNAYGVDDPTTMTSSGLTTTGAGSGASVSVTQETGEDAMLVDITGITFSNHLVRIKRGVITPTKPTDLRTTRTANHRARIGFDKAKARGSKVTGYKVRCTITGGTQIRRASGDGSPIVVRDLKAHRGYDCQVRATSKAGLGRWSASKHVERNPPPGLPSTG